MWPLSSLLKVSHKCLGAGSQVVRAHPDKGEAEVRVVLGPAIFHGGLAHWKLLICIQEVSVDPILHQDT